MWPFTTEEFWLGLWSNAIADLLVGVVLATLVGTLLSRWITKRNAPDLSFRAENAEPGNLFYSEAHHWPPTVNEPAYADFKIAIRNNGRVAAINWLITMEFSYCAASDGAHLVEFCQAPTVASIHAEPVVEVRHEPRGGKEFVRFQYASPADMIHSGYQRYSPASLTIRILFHHGWEAVMPRSGSARYARKNGDYWIYADQMKAKSGRIMIVLDVEKRMVSLSA